MNTNNGLVRNIETASTLPVFRNSEDVNYQFDNYNEYSLKGIQESSPLSRIFFSQKNVDALQKTIRFEVYRAKNKVISNQSPNELYTVMRSIYLQNANSRTSTNKFIKTLHSLNTMVIEYSVQRVIEELEQYQVYLANINGLPQPMEHPKYENKDNKTFDLSNLMGVFN